MGKHWSHSSILYLIRDRALIKHIHHTNMKKQRPPAPYLRLNGSGPCFQCTILSTLPSEKALSWKPQTLELAHQYFHRVSPLLWARFLGIVILNTKPSLALCHVGPLWTRKPPCCVSCYPGIHGAPSQTASVMDHEMICKWDRNRLVMWHVSAFSRDNSLDMGRRILKSVLHGSPPTLPSMGGTGSYHRHVKTRIMDLEHSSSSTPDLSIFYCKFCYEITTGSPGA